MDNIHETLIIESFKTQGYLIINKTLIEKIGLVPAVILSNYIDKYKYFKDRNDNFDGWFYLTHKKIEKQLNLKEHTVIKIKKELLLKGLIKTKKRGIPSKEYITLNFAYIAELIGVSSDPLFSGGQDPNFSGGQEPLFSGGHRNSINTITYNKNKDKDNKVVENFPSTESNYILIASKLARITQFKKNIEISNKKLKAWQKPILMLVEKDKVSIKRIKDALTWYEDHCDDPYVPVIESGNSLRQKFIKLENAIQRENEPKPQSQTKTGYKKGKLKYKKAEKV